MEKRTATHTNRGKKYQIVGNAETVIAEYSKLDDARRHLADTSVEESPHGVIHLVGPGETVTCTLQDGLSAECV